jgi:hypothetical protein
VWENKSYDLGGRLFTEEVKLWIGWTVVTEERELRFGWAVGC